MARPVSIPDDQILEAARAVFTEKGPRGTSAEIAERAGVSEGTLFKRFGSKAGLHKAAMTSDIAGSWIRREMREQAPLRTRKDFERFIRWQITVLRDVVPVVVMAWSFRADAGALPADLAGRESAPLVALRTLGEMLQEEVAAGHLAARNAAAIAQMITGSVWYFVFLELVFNVLDINGQPPPPFMSGWKDTVMVPPGSTVRIAFVEESFTGLYVFHCHNLEHEDHGMMLQEQVGGG